MTLEFMYRALVVIGTVLLLLIVSVAAGCTGLVVSLLIQ